MATQLVASWRVVVDFVGLDLEDDGIVDVLASNTDMHLGLSSSEFVTTVHASVAADSFHSAVDKVLDVVEQAAPEAETLRLMDPLVTIADIADLAGVTRQAVRNWSLGLRKSGFPRPLSIVGDGVRVWRQADVDAWLDRAVALGSGHKYGSAAFIALYNELLQEADSEDAEIWATASDVTEVQRQRISRRVSRGAPSRPASAVPAR